MKLLRIQNTRRLRILPWRYDAPGFYLRRFASKKPWKTLTPKLSPGTYSVPDPLWDARHTAKQLLQWGVYVLPYYDAQNLEFGFVRLPQSIYQQIIQRMVGTEYPRPNADLILERIDEMDGSITLAQALADAYSQSERGWLEEPLDVTDLDDGCDIIVRKTGQGITTRYELTFEEPAPLVGMLNAIKNIMKPDFDVLEALEFEPFNLELYLEECRRNKIVVTDEVCEQLEKLSQSQQSDD